MASITSPIVDAVPNHSMASARVLLGTIAVTGALALTAVVAMAPGKETALLLATLALPWLAAAFIIGLPILIPTAPSKRRHPVPTTHPPHSAIGTLRLAGAVTAIGCLVLGGVLAQQSTDWTSGSSDSEAAFTIGSAAVRTTSVQVAAANAP